MVLHVDILNVILSEWYHHLLVKVSQRHEWAVPTTELHLPIVTRAMYEESRIIQNGQLTIPCCCANEPYHVNIRKHHILGLFTILAEKYYRRTCKLPSHSRKEPLMSARAHFEGNSISRPLEDRYFHLTECWYFLAFTGLQLGNTEKNIGKENGNDTQQFWVGFEKLSCRFEIIA